MSKKYPNPVTKHFIYSDRTRKSTCKRCHFDMAGRHSENLMRHLKRKHEDAYKSVLDEKREIRAALAQQQANKDAVNPTKKVLASKCQYPLTRKKTFITEDDDSQLSAMETMVMIVSSEGVFIGKSEIPDEEYQWKNSANMELTTSESSVCVAPTSTTARAKSPARAASSAALDTSSGDEDYFLRYLGSKLGKYSARTRNTVQFHINRILYKADMGHFEETDSRTGDANDASP
ncbi:GD16371 [Drosophila simulans]|uniref:GD16371 n=1 Tax=Drosophila simulans TaxID=7240 RepID=B4R3H8_DROSI|nr:GD16371 [Drosophila simulans]